jgi:hypothetical protein
LNLRRRYLKLTAGEWMLFIASLACIPAAIWTARSTGDAESRRVFFSLLSYVGLAVIARALVPVYGQALVVALYGTAILGFSYLLSVAWRAVRTSAR